MKRFIALVAVVTLMLTACTNGSDKAKSVEEASKTGRSIQADDSFLDDEAQTVLQNSASLLTKALTSCVYGFSSDTVNPCEKMVLPYNAENAAHFLVMMMYYNDSDEYMKANKSIYSSSIYTDSNDVYHLGKSFIPVILKDTFGYIYSDEIERSLDEKLDFEYKNQTDEYVISADKLMEQNFNLKCISKTDDFFSDCDFQTDNNWICKRIPNVKIDTVRKEITVEYIAENLYSFSKDSEEEITSYKCKNVYRYNVRDNGEYYLKIKSMSIVDYIKTANPDTL